MKRIGAILLLALPVVGNGALENGVAEMLLQNEIRVSGADLSSTDKVQIIVKNLSGVGVRKEFVEHLVRTTLQIKGISSEIGGMKFEDTFLTSGLPGGKLLAPKLVVEVAIEYDSNLGGYRSDSEISVIRYQEAGPGRFKAKQEWTRRQTLSGVSRQEIEDNLAQFIQREMGGVTRALRERKGWTREHQQPQGTSERKGSQLSYRLKWSDPDHRRDRFFFGATAGTPSLVNLHFGFWGSRKLPIVVGLSGMYLSTENRGIQFDLGWAWQNGGDLRHVVGLSAAMLNEVMSNTTDVRDDLGRVISTTVDTVQGLRPYVGPSYILDWGNFRMLLGGGVRIGPAEGSTFRFLFQIGYTPRFSL